jgi:hypothetical protein
VLLTQGAPGLGAVGGPGADGLPGTGEVALAGVLAPGPVCA